MKISRIGGVIAAASKKRCGTIAADRDNPHNKTYCYILSTGRHFSYCSRNRSRGDRSKIKIPIIQLWCDLYPQ